MPFFLLQKKSRIFLSSPTCASHRTTLHYSSPSLPSIFPLQNKIISSSSCPFRHSFMVFPSLPRVLVHLSVSAGEKSYKKDIYFFPRMFPLYSSLNPFQKRWLFLSLLFPFISSFYLSSCISFLCLLCFLVYYTPPPSSERKYTRQRDGTWMLRDIYNRGEPQLGIFYLKKKLIIERWERFKIGLEKKVRKGRQCTAKSWKQEKP